jgi:hypothetical protein
MMILTKKNWILKRRQYMRVGCGCCPCCALMWEVVIPFALICLLQGC